MTLVYASSEFGACVRARARGGVLSQTTMSDMKDTQLKGQGICLVGSFMNKYPTDAQIESLKELLTSLCHVHKIDPLIDDNIAGHNHWNETDCPGKKLSSLLPEIRKQVANKL